MQSVEIGHTDDHEAAWVCRPRQRAENGEQRGYVLKHLARQDEVEGRRVGDVHDLAVATERHFRRRVHTVGGPPRTGETVEQLAEATAEIEDRATERRREHIELTAKQGE